MEKQLNTQLLEEKLAEHGLSQTALAKQVGKTKAAVSKWLTGKSFPRPAELLKLGRILSIKYKDLVVQAPDASKPVVAFRKRGSCITTEKHFSKAEDMGCFLTPLVQYLDFDKFVGPASLKKPSTDYAYLQELVARMRRDMDISESGPIEFPDIVDCFHQYQAVIIPTLWGTKTKHENALHIHLPDSQTTWIYLNLDSKVHDFKYWMAHEFGHVLTIDLLVDGDIEAAEDFADAFAGALLFPQPAAKMAYAAYKKARSEKGRISVLIDYAEQYFISPLSVYIETEKFAAANELDFVTVDQKQLHISIGLFNQKYRTLSEELFDGETPSANHFMRIAQENFGTDFYKALGCYIREFKAPPKSVASILDISPMDAHAFHETLASM